MFLKSCLLIALLGAVEAQAQTIAPRETRTDTLFGRVSDTTKVAISDGEVIVTRGPDRAVFRTRLAADGTWQLIIPDGTGDYLVYVSAPGRVAQRRRVTRAAQSTTEPINFTLATAAAATLARVNVVASRRDTPARTADGLEEARGNSEFERDGGNATISPVDGGNLAASTIGMPGIDVRSGQVSALGLPGDQSLVTLNGLAFQGSELPRGLRTSVRAATTAWDVSRGGFSGAQVDASIGTGLVYTMRSWNVSFDSPTLQVTDKVGRAGASVFARADVNVALSGPVDSKERFAYAFGARYRRRTSDIASFETASDAALLAAGVNPDSARRLRIGIPAIGLDLNGPSRPMRDEIQLAGRVDKRGYDMAAFRELARTYGTIFFFDASRDRGSTLSATALSSTASDLTTWRGGIQGVHSLKGQRWLQDTKVGLSSSRSLVQPQFDVPLVAVLTSASDVAATAPGDVALGGGNGDARNLLSTVLEATHEMQANLDNANRHRIKLFFQSRLDDARNSATPGSLGAFNYLSLADLFGNAPSSFSRDFYDGVQRGRVGNAAVGLGSIYRRSQFFSLQYGARLDASVNLLRQDNDERLRPLGDVIDADQTRRSIGVSPRLGFRWVLGGREQAPIQPVYSPVGQFVRGAPGTLRGGIGLFRGFLDASRVSLMRGESGGAVGGIRSIRCIGADVPTPDWRVYRDDPRSIPSSCTNARPEDLTDVAGIRLVGRNYVPPESWRANLGFGTRAAGTDVDVEVVASLNQRQPSSIDANFAPRTLSRLQSEGGRPVFVPFEAIEPASGLIRPADRTLIPSLGAISVQQSLGRSESFQMRVTLTPYIAVGSMLRLSWVGRNVRSRVNGFDAPTDGDPRNTVWAPSEADTRHQFIAQAGRSFGGLTVEAFVRAESGTPYSPRVRGDVNGDGLPFNDRAFVPTDADGDAALRAAITSVARNASTSVRRCLTDAVGRVAALNGCRAPWTIRNNLRLSMAGTVLRLGSASRVALFIENPLGGIDRLLNGQQLKGWGAVSAPDQFLLAITGWDAAARRYRYSVNERFGATSPQLSALRAPFRMTLDAEIPFGTSLPAQLLDRTVRRARSATDSAQLDTLQIRRTYERTVPNLYNAILAESDSLLLTVAQVEQLTARRIAYVSRVREIWSVFAAKLANEGDRYRGQAALKEQEAAAKVVTEIARQEALRLAEVLSAVQLRLLPFPANYLRVTKRGGILRQVVN